jgi:hypothetical protein
MGRERGVIGGSEQFRVERGGCEVGLVRGASRGGGAQVRGADAQRIGDAGDVGSRRRHVPAWLRRRSAVSGRSCDTQRMPRPAAAAIGGSGGAPVFGVPWCQKTANPAAASPVPVS